MTEGLGLVGTVVLLRRQAPGGGTGALCALEGSRWQTGEGPQQSFRHGTPQLPLCRRLSAFLWPGPGLCEDSDKLTGDAYWRTGEVQEPPGH